MPQIGWFEILIVVAVAIVVICPKDFPLMLKKVGSWIGTIKKYVTNFQNEISILDDDSTDIDTSTLKQEKKNIDKKNEQK